jgi:hypothetical protein
MIHKEEVLEFLYSHRGWIKKSPKDLVARLENLNMPTDIDDVRKLQAEARQKIKYSHPSDANGITSDMKVKKVWFTPGGKMGVSYITDQVETASKDVYDAVEKLIKENVTPYQPKDTEPSTNDMMLSVFTSDKHIGARTPFNSLYSNDYDREEVFDRHDKMIDRLLEQKKKFGKFKKFCYFDLGDALDGADNKTVRGGHSLPQNMDDREQVDTFIEVTIMTIDALVKNDIADEIWFIATSNDNHAGSFGHGALRAIQMYIEAKHPELVKTFVTGKPLDHITFGKHTIIFGHGKDDHDMKSGLPLNLDIKTENFINDYIDRKRIRSKYVHVQKGDLHQSSINYGKKFRYCNNMSMYGSSKWIHSNFGSGKAGVNYEIMDLNGEEIYRSRITYGHDS